MGLKSDSWIRKMSKSHKMIEPFYENLITDEVVSFGLSSYGYDIRVSNEFKIFSNLNSTIIDPKNFSNSNVVDFKGDVWYHSSKLFA